MSPIVAVPKGCTRKQPMSMFLGILGSRMNLSVIPKCMTMQRGRWVEKPPTAKAVTKPFAG